MMYNLQLINVDTDSFTVCKNDGSMWTEKERQNFEDNLNKQFPELIQWCDDGYYSRVLVLKSKNYVLKDAETGKVKIKGSALKDAKKPKMFSDFIKEVVELLLDGKKDQIISVYNRYATYILDVKDIKPWAKKMTITEKVLNPQRTNEQKVFDALQGRPVQEGDKIWVYFKSDDTLSLVEDWNGDYSKKALLKNLFNSIEIFENVLDITQFPNYTLKRNAALLEALNETSS